MEDKYALIVDNISKKFCKDLKKNIIYGSRDLFFDFCGIEAEKKMREGEFWSLRGINFSLKKGEVLGLIGGNGAGKTTVLRLMCGIYPPSEGSISIRGSVSGLISVDSGFHPHMTGRENILLNALLLGFTASQIEAAMSKIIDYAELDGFLDTPVAVYSAGMKAKLGFSIALHRDPDVFLVDEVLSVCDQGFREKALDSLRELKSTTAIVYVSHNISDVEKICDRALLLDGGSVAFDGGTSQAVKVYSELKKTHGL